MILKYHLLYYLTILLMRKFDIVNISDFHKILPTHLPCLGKQVLLHNHPPFINIKDKE